MKWYYKALKIFLYLLLFILVLSLITFTLLHLAPGDPAEVLLGDFREDPTPQALAALRKKAGLDAPLPLQYLRWVKRIVLFDLGVSLRTGESVTKEILWRLPATLQLALSAFVIMIIVSFVIGFVCARFQGKFLNTLGRIWTIVNVSVPSFWLGLLLIYFFAFKWRLLPAMGRGSWQILILPATTLAMGMSAVYGRIFYTSLLQVLSQDYIKLAYAKGLNTTEVLLKHAVKNALLPMITLWGMSFGGLLGGTAIVETIFAWPGMGKFAIEAIFSRDYPVVLGYVIFSGLIFVLVNFFVDGLYQWLNPKIQAI